MYYEFYASVKILSGDNAIFNIPNELERVGCKSPLIVTDKGIVDAGLIEKIEIAFRDAKRDVYAIFSDIPQETSVSSILRALEIADKKGVDGILAVGGGSVMDSAKLISVMLSCGGCSIRDLVGVETMPERVVPLVVVPTTCGTGSEVTSVAVIFDQESGRKMAFAGSSLLPDVAVLDGEMIASLPVKLTASSAMDALTHAIEAHLSIQSNPISEALSEKAIAMIWENLPDAINRRKSKRDINEVRMNLLNAATMAGMAFSNSMVGIVHSLAHAVGSVLHIPHGEAVMLFLVPGLELVTQKTPEKMAKLLFSVPGIREFSGNDMDRANRFLFLLDRFVKDVRSAANIPCSLKDYGFDESVREKVVRLAMLDGSSIFSPLSLTQDVANRMIDRVL